MVNIPTRETDAGRAMLDVAVALTLELAGYPGEEHEAIANAVAFAFDQCDPLADDLETLAATAGAHMDETMASHEQATGER
jgi:hypothetical protein